MSPSHRDVLSLLPQPVERALAESVHALRRDALDLPLLRGRRRELHLVQLLLGRVTYEGFAEVWPMMEENGVDGAAAMNALPKYVASRTLKEATWNATIIEGDVATEVARLKEQPGGDILKYGTGELDVTLLEHGLVDEYHLWVFPVFAGGGQRIFDGFATTHLQLVRTTPFASGIVVHVYEPKR